MDITDNQLREAMQDVEDAAAHGSKNSPQPYEKLFNQIPCLGAAVYAALGSKYLAIGAPSSLGIINCNRSAPLIARCHQMVFGPLQIRIAGKNSQIPKLSQSQNTSCSVEYAFASDIVCVPSNQTLSVDWIADATHLNISLQPLGWSLEAKALCGIASVTMQTDFRDNAPTPNLHGTLTEVIRGQVSGRIGEEITVLALPSTLAKIASL